MADPIKDAFTKAKQDILNLQSQIELLRQELKDTRARLNELSTKTENSINQTTQHITPTHPTQEQALKPQNMPISTGNRGVPTDRQTDRQTDRHPLQTFAQPYEMHLQKVEESKGFAQSTEGNREDRLSHITKVSEVLDSLDNIKKELRSKFKRLTPQEMLIFSTIYQFEEEGFTVDYSSISQKLSLSESSIRDYVLRIIKKGIPLVKIKQNNKKITLSILPELKKIASLQTLLTLREL